MRHVSRSKNCVDFESFVRFQKFHQIPKLLTSKGQNYNFFYFYPKKQCETCLQFKKMRRFRICCPFSKIPSNTKVIDLQRSKLYLFLIFIVKNSVRHVSRSKKCGDSESVVRFQKFHQMAKLLTSKGQNNNFFYFYRKKQCETCFQVKKMRRFRICCPFSKILSNDKVIDLQRSK